MTYPDFNHLRLKPEGAVDNVPLEQLLSHGRKADNGTPGLPDLNIRGVVQLVDGVGRLLTPGAISLENV